MDGDLLAGLEADAVVSNPPYVAAGATLMPDVARYEPHVAVFARRRRPRRDPRLVRAAAAACSSRSSTARARPTPSRRSLRAAGFDETERIRDLPGIERVAVGRR